MSNLKNNGLKKTSRGQEEQISSNLNLTLSGKNVKETVIKDCIVLNVSGVDSFKSFNYLPVDRGSILVDLLLPKGEYLDKNGSPSRFAINVRVRDSEDFLATNVGMLREDFLFDERNQQRVGDLHIRSRNFSNVSIDGEFAFKKPTKKYGSRNGYTVGKASILGEKSSPSLGALHGTLDKSAALKYREIYINEMKKGDYYG